MMACMPTLCIVVAITFYQCHARTHKIQTVIGESPVLCSEHLQECTFERVNAGMVQLESDWKSIWHTSLWECFWDALQQQFSFWFGTSTLSIMLQVTVRMRHTLQLHLTHEQQWLSRMTLTWSCKPSLIDTMKSSQFVCSLPRARRTNPVVMWTNESRDIQKQKRLLFVGNQLIRELIETRSAVWLTWRSSRRPLAMLTSLSEKNAVASPFFPALPVRPIRCT